MVFLSRLFIFHTSNPSYHHHHQNHHQQLRLFFGGVVFWSAFVVPALGQVGLRSSPLTVPKNKNNQGLFSKWTEITPQRKANDSLIDYKLGAIFRGVAYGVSTISPSSEEMEQENMALGEEHHGGHKYHKIPEVVVHTPGMNVISTSTGDSTSNIFKESNTLKDHELNRNDYTKQSDYDNVLLVTQSSTNNVNIQQSVVRPAGDSKTFDGKNKGNTFDTKSKGDDFATHEVLRQNVGPWGEPTPDWILARQAWGVAWEVHIYTVATLYSLLTLFSIYCLARIYVSSHLLPRGYYVTIHLLLFLATFFRSVSLFHDPYSYEGKLPVPLSYVLFNTGAPCLVGALAVLILALLKATRTHLLPPTIQTPLALATIVTFHLGLSIAVDVVVGVMGVKTVPLHVVVQAVTAVWGAALCVGYVWAFSNVERVALRQQGELVRMTFTRVHLEGGMVPSYLPRPSLSRGARITLAATVTGLLLVGLQAYGMVTLKGLWVHHKPQPWPWYSYHSASRLLEILMWTLIGVASALPSGNSQGKHRKESSSSGNGKKEMYLLSMFCNNCAGGTEESWKGSFSSKRQLDDMYPTICQTNQAVHQFTLQTGGSEGDYEDVSTAQRALTQRRVNAGITSTNKRHSFSKSATLHSTTSDIHIFWNQSGGGAPSNVSSHPSSSVFNESGSVSFRTQVDPKKNIKDILRKSSQNLDRPCDDTENPKKTPSKVPKVKEFIHERNKQNGAHRSLKKCQKDLKNANVYNDPYSSGQFEHLLQNRINSELYSNTKKDSMASFQSEVSATDCSLTDVLSHNNDSEWSKYESTCSSISAANSFDIRMYEDFEVASYYHQPTSVSTTGSGNVYSSLHKLTGPRAKVRQHAAYTEEVVGIHNKNGGDPTLPRHVREQFRAHLVPQACAVSGPPQSDLNMEYLTDTSVSQDGFQEHTSSSLQESVSDVCSNVSHHSDEVADKNSVTASAVLTTSPQVPVLQPGTPSRRPLRFNLHHEIMPGSVDVVSPGHTEGDLRSGVDDGRLSNLDMLKINSDFLNDISKTQSRDELLNKLEGSNLSIHGHQYSPLSSEDKGFPSEQGNYVTIENNASCESAQSQQRNKNLPVRPCGHRPRRRQGKGQNGSHQHSKRQQQSCLMATEPLINSDSSAKLNCVTSVHSSTSRTMFSTSNGATQTESQIRPSQSPESSRPSSSLALHSDFPSECANTEGTNNPEGIRDSSADTGQMKKLHKGGKSTSKRAREETGV
ncbi:uncharacterized protein LOC143018578 [Oratosquilla oratoria]|uniref:uncharacterized protein LOC143018578 n=1 Tax=Oratosquilla oratoria TaxID=337810 RepID=UPI003F76B2E2